VLKEEDGTCIKRWQVSEVFGRQAAGEKGVMIRNKATGVKHGRFSKISNPGKHAGVKINA